MIKDINGELFNASLFYFFELSNKFQKMIFGEGIDAFVNSESMREDFTRSLEDELSIFAFDGIFTRI